MSDAGTAAVVAWREFCAQAPDLATRAEAVFAATGVLLLGTIRRDGSPRISPLEAVIADGRLWMGMMPDSHKARDLDRDPRCTVHAAIIDRFGNPGEFKAHGVARPATTEADHRRYAAALEAKIGVDPGTSGYVLHTFALASAALFVTGESSRTVTRWRAGEPPETFEQGP